MVDDNVRRRMEVCCIVFSVDMREKKQTVKYKQTLPHRNTGHNTVTQPTKGTNPITNRSMWYISESFSTDLATMASIFGIILRPCSVLAKQVVSIWGHALLPASVR